MPRPPGLVVAQLDPTRPPMPEAASEQFLLLFPGKADQCVGW